MVLRKAARSQVKLRIGLSSPSGAGKTYSALLLAYGMTGDWNKVVLIDTENGSGDLYSNLGDYSVYPLEAPFSPEKYIKAIKECEDAGMEVIIIDSISHEWEGKGGCLELNDQTAASRFKGNTWSAWSVTTPRHQKFIEAITHSKAHIISTVRNKTETAQIDGKIKKVGTKELTREGFEYELTVNFVIDRETHKVFASKDRTGLFIDRDPFLLDISTGKEIIEWNKTGKIIEEKVIEDEVIENEEDEVIEDEVESKEDLQTERFSKVFDEIKMTAHIDQLSLILGDLKEEIKKDPQYITKDQLNQIGQLKIDMIASFESKAAKKVPKK